MPVLDALVNLAYGAAYYMAVLFFWLSRIPVIGKLFEAPATGARFKVVTVPVENKARGVQAISPFDLARRLVEEASYVAMADACVCRQAHKCADYPDTPGCIYLGEGARAIKHRVRPAARQEALGWLEKARSVGLVTNVIWWPVEFEALGADPARMVEICSCCTCCCLMFKAGNASKAYTENILGFGVCRVIDADACARCTNCERACPFKAIHVDLHAGPGVDEARCRGCGRCEAACRSKVLKVFPGENQHDNNNQRNRSTPNADDMMERFLAMVR